MLDDLRIRVGPRRLRAVWDQISPDLAIPSRQLDLIVDLSQDEAWLARTPADLPPTARTATASHRRPPAKE